MTTTNNNAFLPHLPLGESIPGKATFKRILPNEMWYDNGSYYSVLCIYPKYEKVMDFDDRYEAIKKSFAALLIPVFYLVKHGSVSSYFVLYLRKEPLVVS